MSCIATCQPGTSGGISTGSDGPATTVLPAAVTANRPLGHRFTNTASRETCESSSLVIV